LDHIAKPKIKKRAISKWRKNLKVLSKRSNVYCKLSGIITEADWNSWSLHEIRPYLDVAMHAFGPDRLMFGSDWPVCTLSGTYSDVYNLILNYLEPFSEEHQNAIMGGNAINFYQLNSVVSR